MKYIALLPFFLIYFISCTDHKGNVKEKTPQQEITYTPEAPPVLDTTITLTGISKIKGIPTNVKEAEAKKCLYQYFKKRNVVPQNELQDDAYKRESITCVEYDTIYNINLHPEISAAIISYWLVPAHGGGHCFQARRAIISQTGKGYSISNLDFMPSDFLIDSIGDQAMVYGAHYNCSSNEIERSFKLKIVNQTVY